MSKEETLFSKCLDFTRLLLDKNEEFTFDVKIRTGFSFNFSNQDSGMPALKMKKMMKNRKTPSQIRRNQKRMEIFQQRKKEEATGKPEALAEYELNIDAHAKCTIDDIVEVIETNFYETIKEKKGDQPNKVSQILKIKKIEQKQVITKIEQELQNLQIFKIAVKNIEVARDIIESWNLNHMFDDLAFKNAVYGKIKINIKEVNRINCDDLLLFLTS